MIPLVCNKGTLILIFIKREMSITAFLLRERELLTGTWLFLLCLKIYSRALAVLNFFLLGLREKINYLILTKS
jgi:hypothetical protein